MFITHASCLKLKSHVVVYSFTHSNNVKFESLDLHGYSTAKYATFNLQSSMTLHYLKRLYSRFFVRTEKDYN